MIDGVWIHNGLSAEFRVIKAHPNCPGVYLVECANGEYYAMEHELRWATVRSSVAEAKAYGKP